MVPNRCRYEGRSRWRWAREHTDGRLERVGSPEHGTASLDGIETLPNHSHDRTRGHVRDEAIEEALALEIGVV
jgi:hypothetical protein